jgi:hypothetical protein
MLLGQHVSPKIAQEFGAIASRCSDGGVWHSHPQHHSKEIAKDAIAGEVAL